MKHVETLIYEAQSREDARADSEGRPPRLISKIEDIRDPEGIKDMSDKKQIHELRAEDAIELVAIVRKTIGAVRFAGFELAASRAFTALAESNENLGADANLAGFSSSKWDRLYDVERETFMGLVATLYTTGYEQGVNDARR